MATGTRLNMLPSSTAHRAGQMTGFLRMLHAVRLRADFASNSATQDGVCIFMHHAMLCSLHPSLHRQASYTHMPGFVHTCASKHMCTHAHHPVCCDGKKCASLPRLPNADAGGACWCCGRNRNGFLLPPSEIIPTGEENLEAVLTIAEEVIAKARADNAVGANIAAKQ